VGTHTLGSRLTSDVVGTVAALDVYKFLSLSVDSRTLLNRAMANDPALIEALSDVTGNATDLVAAFASLTEAAGSPTSHTLAKQLYWPMEADSYHLLAPLLSSPLAHAVYKTIGEDRFSDAAKAAREARRTGKTYAHGYSEYPCVGVQKFGGSKPQNISLLNIERRGVNYLLASVPPVWKSAAIRPPVMIETVFGRYFYWRPDVRRLVGALKDFLSRVVDVSSNARIRNARSEMVGDLCGETLQMAAELRGSLTPGWTAQPDCRLNLAEQCWLDPERGVYDTDFAALYRRNEWQDEVSLRFANWLNARLRTDEMHLGAAEAAAWQGALGNALNLLREDLGGE